MSVDPWITSVQHSFLNNFLYRLVIPRRRRTIAFGRYQVPSTPITKGRTVACLPIPRKCSTRGAYLVTLRWAASSSACGSFSNGHVTSIMET